jgi:hypothetical protein
MQQNIDLLINRLEADGTFRNRANNPFLQFELDSKQLLFSELLPERNVEKNQYRETGIRFRTMIANDSTRYSPPQKKNNMLVSSVLVELGDADIAAELSMEAYEAFTDLIDSNANQAATAQLLRMFDNSISMPLALLRERHKAEVFTQGYVTRKGANNFEEIVRFEQPTGHRIAVSGWANPATDILGALKSRRLFLEGKGYTVTKIITTKQVMNDYIIPNNAIQSYGLVTIQAPTGTGVTLRNTSEMQAVLNAFAAYDLPQPTLYEHGYSDQLGGYTRFLQNRLIMVCETGRSQEVDLGNTAAAPIILPNTLGYYGIGRATGQKRPGVATKVEAFTGKDARVEMTGWMTGFPVLQDPEAFAVLEITS